MAESERRASFLRGRSAWSGRHIYTSPAEVPTTAGRQPKRASAERPQHRRCCIATALCGSVLVFAAAALSHVLPRVLRVALPAESSSPQLVRQTSAGPLTPPADTRPPAPPGAPASLEASADCDPTSRDCAGKIINPAQANASRDVAATALADAPTPEFIVFEDEAAANASREKELNESLSQLSASPAPRSEHVWSGISVTSGASAYEVRWTLACSDGTRRSGGAPYSGEASVPKGASCTLSMTDKGDDGWDGAVYATSSSGPSVATGESHAFLSSAHTWRSALRAYSSCPRCLCTGTHDRRSTMDDPHLGTHGQQCGESIDAKCDEGPSDHL